MSKLCFCDSESKQNNHYFLLILTGTEVGRIQATDQDISEIYHTVDLNIVSVEPKPKDLEFYFKEIDETGIGVISFKGCLDHEVREITA